VPKVLYHEFKYFFNMFFLLIALSQFVPFLKVGFMFTYTAPLAFVLLVTMLKEAYDDCKRMSTDRKNNNEEYPVLLANGNFKQTSSKNFKVGNIVKIE
jgi:phospholipid-translocating ATPase